MAYEPAARRVWVASFVFEASELTRAGYHLDEAACEAVEAENGYWGVGNGGLLHC